MKSYINIIKLLSLAAILFVSCNEEEFLKEEPLDFFVPDNAFVNVANFESSLADLYAKKRDIYYGGDDRTMHLLAGTDLFFNARESNDDSRFGTYNSVLNPTKYTPEYFWTKNYKIIANSNTIINKLLAADIDDTDKLLIEAEAKMFRALAYRDLVYLFGGVPLITNEVSGPKVDFVRATKTEVLNQIVEDCIFAAANLPEISKVLDGKLNNLVAQHYLAETYISLGQFSEAITAASVVINDPSTSLMTARFGSLANQPGDVFYDLFRVGNQNRSSGNTEGIWVAQMEVDILGGQLSSGGNAGNILERNHDPAIFTLNDPDGMPGFLGARSTLNVGGRGVSFMRGTPYMEEGIWDDFNNDMRNSKYNFQRSLVYDNPASAYFGESAIEPASNRGSVINSSSWRWYPWLTKATTPGQHPIELMEDPILLTLKNGAASTYRDMYFVRLPETYLLRAEAYLMNSNPGLAAIDINVVRNRANASPINAGDVTIDYILDERGRELALEEQRAITLRRVGKLVERVRLYNDWNAPEIQDYNELFPIPASEIEANRGVLLEQNPGY